ncbi:HEXXH motif domain-containing protein [Streptomyces sp. NPDC004838]
MRPDSLHEARSRHSLTPRQFRELARGGGTSDTLAALARAERSHRLLLFDLLMDALAPLTGVTGPLPEAQRAWDLLAAAERRTPAVVEELLLLPETGLWLNGLLVRLRTSRGGDTPLWAEAGRLHILAAVAAARAGLAFSFPVPVRRGELWLPTLGLARLAGARRRRPCWDTAEVRAAGGRLTVTGRDARLVLPARPEQAAPGWLPVRGLPLDGEAATGVAVDDIGPHRIAPLPYGAPERLSQRAYDDWAGLLGEAFRLLADTDPPTADAAAVLLRSLQPMPAHEVFRVRSVTSAHGVGGFASSVPESVTACAATLVHELQHSKLSALMHLAPLHEPSASADEEAERLYYAPWRDDPRPLGGMLQGAYAFTALARFWLACAEDPDVPDSGHARFESALWLGQLGRVLPELSADPALTPLGRRALQDLRSAVADLGRRSGVGPQETLAHRMALDHRTSWRLAHVRPHPDDVALLAAAWRERRERPPALPRRSGFPAHDSGARYLDARAMLVRIGLADPAALDKLRDGPGETVPGVAGAGRADLLWATGESTAALRLYLRDIDRDADGDGEGDDDGARPTRPGAWTGLRLTLADTGGAAEAVRALTETPELVAAVHRAVRRTSGRPPEPVALAHWLGTAAGPDRHEG